MVDMGNGTQSRLIEAGIAFHDIETMMVDSSAFAKVLVEHGDIEKIELFEATENKTVLNALLEHALPFGRLHWYDYLENLKVCFDDLSPYRFLDRETWTLDEQALKNEYFKLATTKSSAFDSSMEMGAQIVSCE